MDQSNSDDLRKQVENLKARGVSLPRHPAEAQRAASEMHRMANNPGELAKDLAPFKSVRNGRVQVDTQQSIKDMEANARITSAMRRQRTASADASVAIPRFYDPMEYWDLSGLPWNMADEGHRHKLHKWMRLYYSTHYLVPILIDIFTRFPLSGMHVTCKDPELEDFYSDLFLNQLKYEEFLVELGREYWLVGAAYPLGSFNENLGVWEREELINPELIVVENIAPLGEKQLKLIPSESLKQLARTKMPADEYKQLKDNFPDMIQYLLRDEPIPVSDVLLKQIAFKTTNWDAHGTPILLRGLRTLIHEEKLLASQDAVAERLYSPLLLAKLGAPDMGGEYGPWLPAPGQLDEFRDDLDLALSSDFRVMVYHYALEMQNVFGREQVPDLGGDFDRVERRLMQCFGINPSLLEGGSSGEAYASTALHAEFMNQMLKTFQNYLQKHFQERAAVVAEAQGHYDYDIKGDSRTPIMEDVIEYDDEGRMHVVQKPKLIEVNLEMPVLDMRSEATERQFRTELRAMGAPIPDGKLMVGMNFEFDEGLEEMAQETIDKTVKQQETKMQIYEALKGRKLPIPPALKAEVEGIAQEGMEGMEGGPGGPGGPPPGGGMAPPPGGGGETVIGPPMPSDLQDDMGLGPTAEPFGAGPAGSRPPESDQMRGDMPKP